MARKSKNAGDEFIGKMNKTNQKRSSKTFTDKLKK